MARTVILKEDTNLTGKERCQQSESEQKTRQMATPSRLRSVVVSPTAGAKQIVILLQYLQWLAMEAKQIEADSNSNSSISNGWRWKQSS